MSTQRIISSTIRLFVKHKLHNITVYIVCYNSLIRKIFYEIFIQIMFHFFCIFVIMYLNTNNKVSIDDFAYFEYY